jgi:protein-tyrosine-phosphatase
VKLLAVCTANICRSPSIEGVVRQLAESAEVSVEVRSAGTRTVGGQHADSDTVSAARDLNVDLSAHVSQPISAELVDWADVILCAELSNLGAVLGLRDDALVKSFLFLEFAELATIRHATDDVATWLARVGRGRTADSVLRKAQQYNLADPYKRGRRRHDDMLDTVVEVAERIVETWAG